MGFVFGGWGDLVVGVLCGFDGGFKCGVGYVGFLDGWKLLCKGYKLRGVVV